MLLLKLPVPDPLDVLLFAVVGLPEVSQHTPRAVTVAPPSLVIFPPLLAELVVMDETAVVVRVGTTLAGANVVKETWFPYAVPSLFVAYART